MRKEGLLWKKNGKGEEKKCWLQKKILAVMAKKD